jgi:hypothetical protein
MATLSKPQLYKALVAAAMDFASLTPWKVFNNDECLAISVPGEEHPLFASIMGQSGEEFGMILCRGEAAKRDLFEMLQSEVFDDDLAHEMDYIDFSIAPLHEVPEEFRDVLRKAKVKFERNLTVPFLGVKEKGRRLRKIEAAEARVLLYSLRGFLGAWESKMITPVRFTNDVFLPLIEVTGSPVQPDISVDTESIPLKPRRPDGLAFTPPERLSTLPRLDAGWAVGFPHVPASISNDPRSVRGVLVADEQNGLVLGCNIVMGSDIPSAAESLFQVFLGENLTGTRGLPRRIVFSSRVLYNSLFSALMQLGVECELEPGHTLLREIALDLAQHMGGGYQEETGRTSSIPGSSNSMGWRRVSKTLTGRLVRLMEAAGFPDDRAQVRYFGDKETARRVLREQKERSAESAFMEWIIFNYKPRRRERTIAEQLLTTGLPPAERMLLEAQISASPSLFKCVEVRAGESVLMEDILEGGTVRVHDIRLSECPVEGTSFPARIYKAGRFHFISLLGPPLPTIAVPEAIEWIESLGLEPTPEGIRRKAHLLGRLWPWLEEWESSFSRQQFVNFDGDPLSFQTASWAVSDEKSVRRMLAEMADIHYDEEDDHFEWLTESTQASMPGGGPVSAGSLTFVGNELVLQVNSEERLERARSMLGNIPGLTYIGSSRLEAEEGRIPSLLPDDATGPENESETEALDPELIATLAGQMREYYMKWLDEPIPTLDGRTPRQACRSKKGRQKVALMIRTCPDPGGIPGVTVPRKEMLRELGLE